jgi:hypothetical protein
MIKVILHYYNAPNKISQWWKEPIDDIISSFGSQYRVEIFTLKQRYGSCSRPAKTLVAVSVNQKNR